MEIIQIVGIGIVASVLAVVIKQQKPESSMFISIAAGVLIFAFLLSNISYIINNLWDMARRANMDNIYFSTIIKIVGIAYIAEFGAQLCKDAGEGAIASKIEMGGKIIIMVLSIPILTALMDVVLQILP